MIAPVASAAGGDGLRLVRGRAPRSRRVRHRAQPGRRTHPSARCRRPASGPGGQGTRSGSSRPGDRGPGPGNAAAANRDGQRSQTHRIGGSAPAGGCPGNDELDGNPSLLHRALAASFDLDRMSGHHPMRMSLGESAPRLQTRVVLRGLRSRCRGQRSRRAARGGTPGAPRTITLIGRRRLTRSGPTLAKTRKSPQRADRGPALVLRPVRQRAMRIRFPGSAAPAPFSTTPPAEGRSEAYRPMNLRG